MEKYNLVIFGLTFFAAGVASAYKEKTLIVESKTKPGYEFTDSFHPGTDYGLQTATKTGNEFYKFLKDSDALSKPVFAWTPYISKWIMQQDVNVLLMTNILEVKPEADGYRIVLFNSGGITEIFARHIVDTRTDLYKIKKLGFIADGGLVGEASGDAVCVDERGICSVWEMNVSAEDDYKTAREKVFGIFENGFKYNFVAVADEFYKKPDNEGSVISDGYIKRYSSFYCNPVIAFDEGARLGGEL